MNKIRSRTNRNYPFSLDYHQRLKSKVDTHTHTQTNTQTHTQRHTFTGTNTNKQFHKQKHKCILISSCKDDPVNKIIKNYARQQIIF